MPTDTPYLTHVNTRRRERLASAAKAATRPAQQEPTLERQTSNATLRVLACSVLARGPKNKEYSLVGRLIRTILRRNQLKLSLLPPQLRQVIELRFDHQNTRGDTQVAGLLNGSVDEVRACTLMAFKRMPDVPVTGTPT
jgi:hypothetical protein